MPDSDVYSLKQRFQIAVVAPLLAGLLRALAFSWRVRVKAAPGTQPHEGAAFIYAFWHDGVVTVTGHWRGHPIQGLASQSFDGSLISAVMGHLGYPTLARGSSSRGGPAGLRGHLLALKEGRHVVVTLDGPRGPRHQSKPGVLLMARHAGRPVIPVLCAASPDWRLRNWDRTRLPPPFARVQFVLGQPLDLAEMEQGAALRVLHAAMLAGQAEADALLSGTMVRS